MRVEQARKTPPTAWGGRARLRRHAQRCPRLNGVQAQVVADAVQTGHLIQRPDAQIGAQHPDGLILQGGHNRVTRRVHEQVAAGDDTVGHAPGAHSASPRQCDFPQPGTAQVLHGLKAARAEVARGESAHLVDGLNDGRSPVEVHGALAARPGILGKFGGEAARGGTEQLGVGQRGRLASRSVQDDSLQPFAAHQRAQAAARGDAADLLVVSGAGDGGGAHPHLTGRADGDDRAVLPPSFPRPGGRRVGTQPAPLIGG